MDSSTISKMIAEQKSFSKDFQLKMGDSGCIELNGETESYLFDYQIGSSGMFAIYATSISESKQKYQNRFKTHPLIRVDLNGAPHMCEDGQLWENHIHVFTGTLNQSEMHTYKLEDYDPDLFQDLTGWNVLYDFFKCCNINTDNVHLQEMI